jgi:hypothetical protein
MFRFLAGLIKFHPTTPKTKTFFIGVGGVLGGLAGIVNCYIQGDWSNAPLSASWILGGLAAITGRDALSKMAEKVNQ